ncbi:MULTISPECIES: hypothetical protein [unclassified Mesorhizobium]|nr:MULTISPECIES: hypothetical protein [unclassified Mesorhizobium]
MKAEFPDFSVERFITSYPVTNPNAVRAIRHAAHLARDDGGLQKMPDPT